MISNHPEQRRYPIVGNVDNFDDDDTPYYYHRRLDILYHKKHHGHDIITDPTTTTQQQNQTTTDKHEQPQELKPSSTSSRSVPFVPTSPPLQSSPLSPIATTTTASIPETTTTTNTTPKKKLVNDLIQRHDVVVFMDESGLYGSGSISSLLNSPLLEDVSVRIVRVGSSSSSSSMPSTACLIRQQLMEQTGRSTTFPMVFVHGCYIGGNEQIQQAMDLGIIEGLLFANVTTNTTNTNMTTTVATTNDTTVARNTNRDDESSNNDGVVAAPIDGTNIILTGRTAATAA